MYKLINANFFRLKKDTIFWLLVFMSLGVAGFTIFRFKSNDLLFDVNLDRLVNEFVIIIGLFISIFVSIFIGKENSEGTIRNKLIARTY